MTSVHRDDALSTDHNTGLQHFPLSNGVSHQLSNIVRVSDLRAATVGSAAADFPVAQTQTLSLQWGEFTNDLPESMALFPPEPWDSSSVAVVSPWKA